MNVPLRKTESTPNQVVDGISLLNMDFTHTRYCVYPAVVLYLYEMNLEANLYDVANRLTTQEGKVSLTKLYEDITFLALDDEAVFNNDHFIEKDLSPIGLTLREYICNVEFDSISFLKENLVNEIDVEHIVMKDERDSNFVQKFLPCSYKEKLLWKNVELELTADNLYDDYKAIRDMLVANHSKYSLEEPVLLAKHYEKIKAIYDLTDENVSELVGLMKEHVFVKTNSLDYNIENAIDTFISSFVDDLREEIISNITGPITILYDSILQLYLSNADVQLFNLEVESVSESEISLRNTGYIPKKEGEKHVEYMKKLKLMVFRLVDITKVFTIEQGEIYYHAFKHYGESNKITRYHVFFMESKVGSRLTLPKGLQEMLEIRNYVTKFLNDMYNEENLRDLEKLIKLTCVQSLRGPNETRLEMLMRLIVYVTLLGLTDRGFVYLPNSNLTILRRVDRFFEPKARFRKHVSRVIRRLINLRVQLIAKINKDYMECGSPTDKLNEFTDFLTESINDVARVNFLPSN